jgi:hypothetical protein
MLLEPVIWHRHPFVGWIMHVFLITGPNTVTPYALGGGAGNTPFIDILNSAVAPFLWTIVKENPRRGRFFLDGTAGLIKKGTSLEDGIIKDNPYLGRHLDFMNLVLRGDNMAAWLQDLFGRPERESMIKQAYIEYHEKFQKMTKKHDGLDYINPSNPSPTQAMSRTAPW